MEMYPKMVSFILKSKTLFSFVTNKKNSPLKIYRGEFFYSNFITIYQSLLK